MNAKSTIDHDAAAAPVFVDYDLESGQTAEIFHRPGEVKPFGCRLVDLESGAVWAVTHHATKKQALAFVRDCMA